MEIPRARRPSATASRPQPESAVETLTRASYFSVALDILAEEGPASLTITELCRRLGVTKGSFYHHFEGRPQFVDALLEYWVSEHASRLIRVSESISDPDERRAVLKSIAIGLPHDAEAAIRSWSAQDGHVAAAQTAVDRARLDHLRDSYIEAGIPRPRAELFATIAMSVLAGMQQVVHPTDPSVVRAVFDQLEQWVVQEGERAGRSDGSGQFRVKPRRVRE
jgi:AcrR family transcriptional regulator